MTHNNRHFTFHLLDLETKEENDTTIRSSYNQSHGKTSTHIIHIIYVHLAYLVLVISYVHNSHMGEKS